MNRLVLLLALLLAILANLAVWALPNRPVLLEPPPGGKLRSISFAPFHDGQSPLTQIYPSLDQIDRDLRIVSEQVSGIRTYTSLEGMENVPALARKHGLTVTMGAWLSSMAIKNELEITSLIKLANEYPDVIKRVIVGNEVLLRGDLSPAQLAGYLDRVRHAIKQPVSTADVWEYWLKFPQMARSVDYLTIHLLPYWEDDPAGVDSAAERILSAYRQIAARFPGKPILVGEAGWPTAGRTRGPAVPGLVNKARFDTMFVRMAREQGFDYNLIEAFDQSWKIKLEGTVGGKWGLYSTGRQPKYSLTKPVVEDVRWPLKAALSIGLGLALLALTVRKRPALPAACAIVVSFASQGLASAFVHAADSGISWHYYIQDLLLAGGVLVLQAVLVPAILLELVRLWSAPVILHDADEPPEPEGLALAFWGGKAMTVLCAIAILWTALLIFDGRYRDFPIAPFLIPAIGTLLLALCRAIRRPPGCDLAVALSASHLLDTFVQRAPGADSRHSIVAVVMTVPVTVAFGLLPLLGAGGLVFHEGVVNREAILWAILQAMLALPYLARLMATFRGTEPLPPEKQL
ncbi:MAG: glycoside hydrolase [Rhodospirillaceae bacterium]